MGSSRTAVLKQVFDDPTLREPYLQLFGALPAGLDIQALPEHAGPFADKAAKDRWFRLSRQQRKAVNRVYANVGKAIAAYERTLRYQPSRFDQYLDDIADGAADSERLSDTEKRGARLFLDASKTQCMQCHNGPTFSNGGFHNIGTGNFSGEHLDYGRVFGLQAVLMDEFNCLGPFSDAAPDQCTTLRFLNRQSHTPLEGAFKTPSLRHVARTPPYFHDGSKADLAAVMEHYVSPPDPRQQGNHELNPLSLTESEIQQLIAFLGTLTEEGPTH